MKNPVSGQHQAVITAGHGPIRRTRRQKKYIPSPVKIARKNDAQTYANGDSEQY